MLGTIYRAKSAFHCPQCLGLFTQAAGVDTDHPPRPGDVTLCCYCLAYLVFDEGPTLRAMTAAEESDLEPELRTNLAVARQVAPALARMCPYRMAPS